MRKILAYAVMGVVTAASIQITCLSICKHVSFAVGLAHGKRIAAEYEACATV